MSLCKRDMALLETYILEVFQGRAGSVCPVELEDGRN